MRRENNKPIGRKDSRHCKPRLEAKRNVTNFCLRAHLAYLVLYLLCLSPFVCHLAAGFKVRQVLAGSNFSDFSPLCVAAAAAATKATATATATKSNAMIVNDVRMCAVRRVTVAQLMRIADFGESCGPGEGSGRIATVCALSLRSWRRH